MKKITSFIVEDNINALNLLCNDLNQYHEEIEIIGKATSVVEALKKLQKIEPDILFLDIMLGDGTSFDILEIIGDIKSKIIFITANDDYAIKAFKFSAIDYILKPYSLEDLNKSIERVKKQISPKNSQIDILKNIIKNPEKRINKLSLSTLEKIIIVNIKDIICCKSDNNYTTFFFNDNKKILVSKTLKYYSDLLKNEGFIRVHQSHLVNKYYIKEYIKSDGGYLILKNNFNIPVSMRKRAEVLNILSEMQ